MQAGDQVLVGTPSDATAAALTALGIKAEFGLRAVLVEIQLPEETGIRAGDYLIVADGSAQVGDQVLERTAAGWAVRRLDAISPKAEPGAHILRALVRSYPRSKRP
ncbi:MAG: hypothetical protein IT435_16015 [Phycisphaerales bacterium]|nr:hypothetical protein [Phycisphaerales bacterium]